MVVVVVVAVGVVQVLASFHVDIFALFAHGLNKPRVGPCLRLALANQVDTCVRVILVMMASMIFSPLPCAAAAAAKGDPYIVESTLESAPDALSSVPAARAPPIPMPCWRSGGRRNLP
ncbi:hypothetical protein CRUP_014898 [Coryphaenoides rupestris]|nr:hypothetical protein CRUP_014898 [Coryphaenoides rupestris]